MFDIRKDKEGTEMNKEQYLELLEKRLADWEKRKESGEPYIDYSTYLLIFFICMLEFNGAFTKEETERLTSIMERHKDLRMF